jgi:hypothetical protein
MAWPDESQASRARSLNGSEFPEFRGSDFSEPACGIEHKYEGDNDLYLVLGTVPPEVAARAASGVEDKVRDRLARHPVDLRLDLKELSIVCYEVETLDPVSTTAHPLTGASVTPQMIEALYDS